MRFDVAFYSGFGIRDRIPQLIGTFASLLEAEPTTFELFGRMDCPSEYDVTAVAQMTSTEREGNINILFSKVGCVSFSWNEGPAAVLQLVNASLVFRSPEPVRRLFHQISSEIGVCYAHADLEIASPVQEWELVSAGRAIPPYGCLRDIFWLNLFGPELTAVLQNVHRISFEQDFLTTRTVDGLLEVEFSAGPKERLKSDALAQFARHCGVFMRYAKTAKFKSDVAYNCDAVRNAPR